MQYMLLIYEDEAIYGDGRGSPLLADIIRRHSEFARDLEARGVLRGGAGLTPTTSATTLRTQAGSQAIHDGPFAETREQLGGYYLIEVPDLDAATAIARGLPIARDGAVEIRPLMDND